MSTCENGKVTTEMVQIANACRDFPDGVIATAYARYLNNQSQPWAKSSGSVNYRGITIESRFLTELADCCFRWGLSDQLGEILTGHWGVSIISSMAYSSVGKSSRKQSSTEKQMATHGKGGDSGVSMRVKSRYVFRSLRDEVYSIMGIASGILWCAQKDWYTGFPTRVVKVYKGKTDGVSCSLSNKPTLFEAFFPLSGKTTRFCANLTDEQKAALEVVCSTNRSENPDLWQGISWRAHVIPHSGEKHWGNRKIPYVRMSNRSSLGGNILRGKLRANTVHSAICSAVYGYIQHEYGSEFKVISPDSWENEQLRENQGEYLPYTASNFVEECPMEVLQYLAESGRVQKTALKIVRALQSRNDSELERRKKFNLRDVLSLINATRGEGEAETKERAFYYAWDSLVATAKAMMTEEIVKEEMSFGGAAKRTLS